MTIAQLKNKNNDHNFSWLFDFTVFIFDFANSFIFAILFWKTKEWTTPGILIQSNFVQLKIQITLIQIIKNQVSGYCWRRNRSEPGLQQCMDPTEPHVDLDSVVLCPPAGCGPGLCGSVSSSRMLDLMIISWRQIYEEVETLIGGGPDPGLFWTQSCCCVSNRVWAEENQIHEPHQNQRGLYSHDFLLRRDRLRVFGLAGLTEGFWVTDFTRRSMISSVWSSWELLMSSLATDIWDGLTWPKPEDQNQKIIWSSGSDLCFESSTRGPVLTAHGSGPPRASLLQVQDAGVTDQQVLHVLVLLHLIRLRLHRRGDGGGAVRTSHRCRELLSLRKDMRGRRRINTEKLTLYWC